MKFFIYIILPLFLMISCGAELETVKIDQDIKSLTCLSCGSNNVVGLNKTLIWSGSDSIVNYYWQVKCPHLLGQSFSIMRILILGMPSLNRVAEEVYEDFGLERSCHQVFWNRKLAEIDYEIHYALTCAILLDIENPDRFYPLGKNLIQEIDCSVRGYLEDLEYDDIEPEGIREIEENIMELQNLRNDFLAHIKKYPLDLAKPYRSFGEVDWKQVKAFLETLD